MCSREVHTVRPVLRAAALLVAVAGFLVPAAAAHAQTGQNRIVRADLITEVQPVGWRVVAVAIEYANRIDVGGADIPNSAFTVAATINNTTANRTVTDVYTNDAPEVDRRGARGTAGRYVIVELDPNDPNSGANVSVGGLNTPVPLVGAYTIRQTANIRNADDDVELRAQPFGVTNQGVINPIVDDFVSMTFTDTAGTRLPFRLYQPARAPERRSAGHPLVLFLQGAGGRGANNLSQITSNQGAVAFAKPERQRSDPSYVLAPQIPGDAAWTQPNYQAAVIALLDQVMATYPIDPDRVYLAGISLGAFGGFDILPKYPDRFAGAILVAGSGDPSRAPLMRDVPLWANHSVDDPVVNYTTGSLAMANAIEAAGAPVTRGVWRGDLPDRVAEARALELWATADANGSHTLLTTYEAGTTPVNGHFSWVPTYQNDVMIDWLFSHDLQDREPDDALRYSAAGWRGAFAHAG